MSNRALIEKMENMMWGLERTMPCTAQVMKEAIAALEVMDEILSALAGSGITAINLPPRMMEEQNDE
jgi:hypothetical protein